MCVTALEEEYQQLKKETPRSLGHLARCARQASVIQNQMRAILDEAATPLCALCEHKCCEGFPLEGWFSLEDYVLFRQKYDMPVIPLNRINRSTACSFLTPGGCSLPADMRPFTCVKINCEKLNDVLRSLGIEDRFNRLRKGLDEIHREVSRSIRGENAVPAPRGTVTGGAKDAHATPVSP